MITPLANRSQRRAHQVEHFAGHQHFQAPSGSMKLSCTRVWAGSLVMCYESAEAMYAAPPPKLTWHRHDQGNLRQPAAGLKSPYFAKSMPASASRSPQDDDHQGFCVALAACLRSSIVVSMPRCAASRSHRQPEREPDPCRFASGYQSNMGRL